MCSARASSRAPSSALERMPELEAHHLYLANDVARAAKRGVMPSDLLAGLHVFRARFFEGAELGAGADARARGPPPLPRERRRPRREARRDAERSARGVPCVPRALLRGR